MNLKDIETVGDLQRELQHWRRTLRIFEAVPSDTVRVLAVSGTGVDYGRPVEVDLPPMAKELAVNAAKAEVDRVISKLAELVVSVDPED